MTEKISFLIMSLLCNFQSFIFFLNLRCDLRSLFPLPCLFLNCPLWNVSSLIFFLLLSSTKAKFQFSYPNSDALKKFTFCHWQHDSLDEFLDLLVQSTDIWHCKENGELTVVQEYEVMPMNWRAAIKWLGRDGNDEGKMTRCCYQIKCMWLFC